MMEFKKIDIRNLITRIIDFNDNQTEPYQNQNFNEIKIDCLRNKKLFTDPLFPTNNHSLFHKRSPPAGIQWKRASDIARDKRLKPKLIENNAHANDLNQGYIGDCWFIAACAAIAQIPELFMKVVPKTDQSFEENEYIGAFHFRFWIYGKWYDVVVDDFLPVWRDGSLVFCQNKSEPNEFWVALIEKAYAKVYGSYENIDGGFAADALVDMTGGIQETYSFKNMRRNELEDFWEIIKKTRQLKSMAAAYIEPNPHVREARLPNGLVMGHAYTITRVAEIEHRGRDVKLIRLRNPWGNEVEWLGKWSDNSSEWNGINDDLKKGLDYRNAKEGEFWMCYEDFCSNFQSIQLCNLTPDAFSEQVLVNKTRPNSTWKMVAYHGQWVAGKTAGGCGQSNPASFWTNPQFMVSLTSPDSDTHQNKCTMIAALLQKYTREKRIKTHSDSAEEFIQFRVFKIKNANDVESSKRNGTKLYANQLEKFGSTDAYINRREITKRFLLPPGDYLIIPSCYDYGNEGEFLLRIFTEKPIEQNHTQILTEDKKNLTDDDIYFFKTVNADQSFANMMNLLGDLDDDSPSTDHSGSSRLSVGTSSRVGNVSPTPFSSSQSVISNLVIRSGIHTSSSSINDNHTNKRARSPQRSTEFEVRKIVAKYENKKPLKKLVILCNY